jgi:hypothetical protein
MRIDQTLSDDKKLEIQTFLIERFNYLDSLRNQLDTDILKEIDAYNNLDEAIDNKKYWEEKVKVPFIYTMVQTVVARIMQALFPTQNYAKIYIEDPKLDKIRVQLEEWVQEELDKIKLSSRSRDYIEDALVKRTSWLQLRPMKIKKLDKSGKNEKEVEGYKLDFDILDWFAVWFDTQARTVMDSDFFVEKKKKLWEIKGKPDVYFNLDQVTVVNNETDEENRSQEYKAKNSSINENDVSTGVDYSVQQQRAKSMTISLSLKKLFLL